VGDGADTGAGGKNCVDIFHREGAKGAKEG
jgi:hypothetical protein